MTRRSLTHGALALLVSLAIPLAAHAGTTTAAHHGAKAAAAEKSGATAKEHAKHMAPKTDLNSASAEAIAALPGLDQATAEKIVAARPFKTTHDLVTKGILTKDQFSKISRQVIARQAKSMSQKPNTESGAKKESPETTPNTSGSTEGGTK